MSEAVFPLEQLATEANARLDRAKVAEDRVHGRISAGEILAEAKDRVLGGEAGDTNWARWVRKNIKYSFRDANQCITIAREAAKLRRSVSRSLLSSTVLETGDRLNPGQASDSLKPPDIASIVSAVTIDSIKRDIQLLSAEDRAVLVEWLTPRNEVQRDRYGNVLDPLPIRLRRVLHRLKKGNSSTGTTSKYEKYIYDELHSLSESLRYDSNHARIADLYFSVGQLVHDLTGGDHQQGLRELEVIVTELGSSSIDLGTPPC